MSTRFFLVGLPDVRPLGECHACKRLFTLLCFALIYSLLLCVPPLLLPLIRFLSLHLRIEGMPAAPRLSAGSARRFASPADLLASSTSAASSPEAAGAGQSLAT
eukprot:23699-Hanusia_phi.AAC.1